MNNISKLRTRKIKSVTNPIMKGLLRTSLAAGVVGVVLVAPNSLQAFDALVKQIDKTKKRSKRFSEYARRSGYFEITECGKNQYAVKLTNKGNDAAMNLLYEDYELPSRKKWDGKWHVLTFDILEENKYLRDLISNKVTELGMMKLQNSVYVYPYSFSEFLDNLHTVYPQATKYVISMIATHIDGEKQLVNKFHKAKIL